MTKRHIGRLALTLAAILLCAAPALASEVTIPNTFTSGTTASAAEVNANFSALATGVNDNHSRISTLESAGSGGAGGAQPANVVVVSHTGDNTTSGTALLDAMSGITDASETNRYTVLVGPGTFDLGATGLTVTEYVSLVGSGTLATILDAADSGGTLKATETSQIRFMTVRNSAGRGITYTAANVAPTQIPFGVMGLSHVLVGVTGGTDARSVHVTGIVLTIHDSWITGEGASNSQHGLLVRNGGVHVYNSNIEPQVPDGSTGNSSAILVLSTDQASEAGVRIQGSRIGDGHIGVRAIGTVTTEGDLTAQATIIGGFIQGALDTSLVADNAEVRVIGSLIANDGVNTSVVNAGTIACVGVMGDSGAALSATCE